MRRRSVVIVLLAAASATLGGCAAVPLPVPAPSGPCLDDLPEISNMGFVQLDRVELDVQGDTEVVRFVFDPTSRGFGSVTAEPAHGPFTEAASGQVIAPVGDRLTSVKFESLAGVREADRVREEPGSLLPVREVVRVEDPNVTRFVIGTVAGACLRFRADPALPTVSLIVSPR